MDFEKLYRIMTIGKRTALHVRPLDDIPDDVALFGGGVKPQRALRFDFMKGASGSTVNDFISTSLPPLVLVSNRVVEVLGAFTGWTTYPVEVYGKRGESIPGYHGLAVTGRCGPIDDSQSRLVIEPPPVPQGRPRKKWVGLYFDPKTWDGSDLFLPESGGGTFVTEGVRTAMESAHISNVRFTRLTEAENMSSALLFGKGIQR